MNSFHPDLLSLPYFFKYGPEIYYGWGSVLCTQFFCDKIFLTNEIETKDLQQKKTFQI